MEAADEVGLEDDDDLLSALRRDVDAKLRQRSWMSEEAAIEDGPGTAHRGVGADGAAGLTALRR